MSAKYVDFANPAFLKCAATIVLAPLIWNVLGRSEYYYHWLRKALGRSNYACYALAVWIIFFSSYRDYLFQLAMDAAPAYPALADSAIADLLAAVCIGSGQLFVLSSFYQLGFTGTFLGDYCGILMDHRVSAFPFNVLDNPMYVGSTLTFVGAALWRGSVAGLVLAGLVFACYQVAIVFEGSFTSFIYATADKEKAKIDAAEERRKAH